MSDSDGDPGTFADDSEARTRALDVGRSFLVQAPAGSGKTELLIQRFLALLAHVERPERVVAMTFTRKAAGEMRDRILGALANARNSVKAKTPHEQLTQELARDVLAQDERHGWHLTAHPARLAVQTIDAFCAGLARQAPLATGLGGASRFVERAQPLYEAATREGLAAADANDAGWRRILEHFDNDAGAVVAALAGVLGKRDQWLRLLHGMGREAFRGELEAALAREIEGELAAIAAAFPAHLARALQQLLRHAVQNADGATRVEEIAPRLKACADAGGLPQVSIGALDAWRALASWLLVAGEPQFRKAVDKRDGFPSPKSGSGGSDHTARIAAMEAILAELAAVPGLAEALDAARRLPPPCYSEEAWSVVVALLDLLPRLAARLTVAFRDAGALDFTQGMLGALAALGSEERPSDLLLALDLRIDHLLIDEFQDTSFTQLELLRLLTAGWQPGDGHTLFAVGDPMQSIYRFREAEVRIFVEAQAQQRVAGVPVESLVLARNFRSHAGLVAWVNDVFPRVFPGRSDPWRGAVAFAPAIAGNGAPPGPGATLEIVADDVSEADRVVGLARAALDAGDGSVAVLVRARTHLDRVLPALREADIAYTAVELDALSERQAILDLASLTHALIQPADRLAWLSVLRAPWCGLVLADLVAVVAAADAQPSRSIAALLEAPAAIAGLSDEGHERLVRTARCLVPAIASRGRAALSDRVRGAWLALGGGAVQKEGLDIGAAERYFALLAEYGIAGDLPDWPAFVASLDALRAEAAADVTTRLQVMTLHRAKGLEFDTVIMPGLARTQRNRDAEVLRWRAREQGLLLAPARRRGGEAEPVYEYLRRLAIDEDRAELSRLVYVGATRARTRLHLIAALEPIADGHGDTCWKPPGTATALARLWDALGAQVTPPPANAAIATPDPLTARPLRRVKHGWNPPLPGPGVPARVMREVRVDTLPFEWAHETARCIGVVAHRMLAQIGREGIAAWGDARVTGAMPRIRAELRGESVDEAELDRATGAVRMAIVNVLADERGRWLFAAEHADAVSEWALAGIEGDAIAHVVLDRSFVADGVRWIVDFKTGGHEGADVQAFLDRETERYREQLNRYARFVSSLDSRPIRLGLYHPLLRGWSEWRYEPSDLDAAAAKIG